MSFAAAANWVCQNRVDVAIVATLAAAAVMLVRRAYQAHREEYRASEELANKWANRKFDRPKLPPHAPRN